jgi:pyrimidine-nucleoside phosphorylase
VTPVKLLLDMKREGGELAEADIRALVASYTAGDVPDYQMAAFAMAVCCKGMSAQEMYALTDAMRLSGECLDWSECSLPTADKHSTGGIGDKLSFLIQPIVAACGVAVPSLAGRGLGLTGGTIDKLESIPGCNATLSLIDFKKTVLSCGVSISAQTKEIAPADRKLYALRDVTGTVPSIPLIVASILSKKLAEGAMTLVFDVKCGKGAFMKTKSEAVELAKALTSASIAAGRRASALVTAMDEPLGKTVGNALEVKEAYNILHTRDGDKDIIALSLELAALMVQNAKGISLEFARAECLEKFNDGSAEEKFLSMIRLQGGDMSSFLSSCDDDGVCNGAVVRDVVSAEDGWVQRVDAEKIAQAAFELGAGRMKSDDLIDLSAGVILKAKRGGQVKKGDVLVRLVTSSKVDKFDVAEALVLKAYSFATEEPQSKDGLILERI